MLFAWKTVEYQSNSCTISTMVASEMLDVLGFDGGYKDKLKANLSALQIDNKDFELDAHDRDAWKHIFHQQIRQFSAACIKKLKETSVRTLTNTNLPATLSLNSHTCVHCDHVCKSLAGLKCHFRLSKCRLKQQ